MIISLKMIPPTVTAQEHKVTVKNGKPVFYDPPALKEARNKLAAHLSEYVPQSPYNVPLKLQVKWCWPSSGKHWSFRATKPDTDNLNKMLKDVMTDLGFWKDDCLVVQEMIEKFYADPAGIYILLEPAIEEEHNDK